VGAFLEAARAEAHRSVNIGFFLEELQTEMEPSAEPLTHSLPVT
jgi:hypothetical protein